MTDCSPLSEMGPRKSRLLCLIVPVPQTDTGGLRANLGRVAGETPLRNSANWPRNFGRRGAHPVQAGMGRRKLAVGTVY